MPSGESVEAHLRGCAVCSELCRSAALGERLAAAARQSLPNVTPELAVVESAIADERGLRAFLRSRSTRLRWVLSLSLPVLFLLGEGLHRKAPWRELTTPRLLCGVALFALLALVLRSALTPLALEPRTARLSIAWSLVAWCLPGMLWLAPHVDTAALPGTGDFTLRSLSCFAYGSAFSVPSFALLWALQRGDEIPFRVWALGAGVVALVANLILLVHCLETDRTHLVMGHLSVGLAWFLAVCAAHWQRLERLN